LLPADSGGTVYPYKAHTVRATRAGDVKQTTENASRCNGSKAIRGARARGRNGRYLAADNGLKNHHLQGLTGFKANYAGAQARA